MGRVHASTHRGFLLVLVARLCAATMSALVLITSAVGYVWGIPA